MNLCMAKIWLYCIFSPRIISIYFSYMHFSEKLFRKIFSAFGSEKLHFYGSKNHTVVFGYPPSFWPGVPISLISIRFTCPLLIFGSSIAISLFRHWAESLHQFQTSGVWPYQLVTSLISVQKDYIFPFQFPFIGRVISEIGMGAVTWTLQYNLRKYAFTTESK